MSIYRIYFLGTYADYTAPDATVAIDMFVAEGNDQNTIDDIEYLGEEKK